MNLFGLEAKFRVSEENQEVFEGFGGNFRARNILARPKTLALYAYL